MNPLIRLKKATPSFVVPFVLTWFALAPQARAICQEGCLGNFNTVLGDDALISNTGGQNNTAVGIDALFSNTTGFANTATGAFALAANATGDDNTANGSGALEINQTGSDNTAIGFVALDSNTTGGSNTATGVSALFANTTGGFNTASGANTLQRNTNGGFNVANGGFALFSNTTGSNNVADGGDALFSNTTGSSNIAVGAAAGVNLTTGSNNIDIGNGGVAADINTMRIGTQGTQVKTFIAGISGTGVSGSAVKINSNGQLGVAPSSVRFKDDIKPMEKASEAILALKPVTFRYKHDLEPEGIPQFGLVAEDVEKVNPDLVARDDQGKPYTVRYEAVNAMLLNEFLKEHRTVQELKKQVSELTAGLQKVSAQLELSKTAAQTVLNDQ
jgi:hypothetical protein